MVIVLAFLPHGPVFTTLFCFENDGLVIKWDNAEEWPHTGRGGLAGIFWSGFWLVGGCAASQSGAGLEFLVGWRGFWHGHFLVAQVPGWEFFYFWDLHSHFLKWYMYIYIYMCAHMYSNTRTTKSCYLIRTMYLTWMKWFCRLWQCVQCRCYNAN